jgi:hypothetical protein
MILQVKVAVTATLGSLYSICAENASESISNATC